MPQPSGGPRRAAHRCGSAGRASRMARSLTPRQLHTTRLAAMVGPARSEPSSARRMRSTGSPPSIQSRSHAAAAVRSAFAAQAHRRCGHRGPRCDARCRARRVVVADHSASAPSDPSAASITASIAASGAATAAARSCTPSVSRPMSTMLRTRTARPARRGDRRAASPPPRREAPTPPSPPRQKIPFATRSRGMLELGLLRLRIEGGHGERVHAAAAEEALAHVVMNAWPLAISSLGCAADSAALRLHSHEVAGAHTAPRQVVRMHLDALAPAHDVAQRPCGSSHATGRAGARW